MRRRDLIKAFAGATIGWPLAARAQIAKVRRIGVLSPFTRSDTARWNEAFLKGLRDLGWIDGKNIAGVAALSWPLAARAQQPAMPVIGFLGSRGPSDALPLLGRADEVIE